MKLIEFSDRYSDEASCERELRSIREKNGIVCSKCGNKHHWWVKKTRRSRYVLRAVMKRVCAGAQLCTVPNCR
ncbi:MAG: hypothetical protein JJE45_06660 [Prolixibacteraceae bacterium]|nr:hypothetical protein [Prolixibacteraceae bacterium]